MADLRETLKALADYHDGYADGVGPCVCEAHLVAREALAAEPTESPDAAWWETMRQVHARHDLGHKLGAWPHACALCEASQALRSEQEKADDWQPRPGEKVVWSE